MSGRDTSFYYSFLVLPPPKRRAILAVWDFCRAVDDAVDERAAAGGSEHELEYWRAELARCYNGDAPETRQGQTLQPILQRFDLSRQHFEDVIDGVEMDLDPKRRYHSFDDLYEYCRRVASAVGLICVELFGCRQNRAHHYAIDLGIALQLTNIIRDISSDLARGRVYVPLEDLDRFGCTEADLADGIVSKRVRGLMEHQCRRARSFYDSARRELPRAEARRLVAAEIMREIYFEILKRVEAADYDVFSRRISVPRPRRAWIAATTWVRTMTLRRGGYSPRERRPEGRNADCG
jgi:phytoene synthase